MNGVLVLKSSKSTAMGHLHTWVTTVILFLLKSESSKIFITCPCRLKDRAEGRRTFWGEGAAQAYSWKWKHISVGRPQGVEWCWGKRCNQKRRQGNDYKEPSVLCYGCTTFKYISWGSVSSFQAQNVFPFNTVERQLLTQFRVMLWREVKSKRRPGN